MSKVTIKDIARLLKLNPSTVSRALRDHPDISVATKTAVKKLAEDLNYHPSMQAIHFREKKSGLIGLILPEMNMFFVPTIIETVERICKENKFQLIIFQSNNSLEQEKNNVRVCEQFGVDGVIASLTPETKDLGHFEELVEEGIPVVLFDKFIDHSFIPRVGIDDYQASFDSVMQLKPVEGEIICGIFGDPGLKMTDIRLQGFLDGLDSLNFPVKAVKILFAKNSGEAKSEVEKLLTGNFTPDAYFAMSDEILTGLGAALVRRGELYPPSSRIVSISEGKLPYHYFPGSSFLEHSAKSVSSAAVDMLMSKLIHKKEISGKCLTIQTHFRKSIS